MSILKKMKTLVGIEDFDEEDIEDEKEEAAEKPPVDIWPAAYAPQHKTEFRETGSSRDKVISMKRTLNAITSQFDLVVSTPKNFNDCPKLVDHLKSRRPVILNLEHVEAETARKIFDFMSGATCALNGAVESITGNNTNTFVFVPENINVISNDEHKGMDFKPGEKNPWR